MSRLQQLILSALAILLPTCLGGSYSFMDEVQTRQKGENVTLNCSELAEDEQLLGVYWHRGDLLQAQMGSKKDISYPVLSTARRLSLGENLSLSLWGLEVSDTGNFTCQLLVRNTTSGAMNNGTQSVYLIVQDVPSAPGQASVINAESRQVTVTWTASVMDSNSPIISYIIEIKECQDEKSSREEVVSGSTFTVDIRDLVPFTCYRVQVRARNGVGRSLPGPSSGDFVTEPEAPSGSPENIQAVSRSMSEITLTWQPPMKESLNGELKGYKITYVRKDRSSDTLRIDDPDKTEMVLQGLEPFTWYEVSIQAFNEIGDGPKKEVAVHTLEGLPSNPRITHISGRDANSLYVHWEPPKQVNGHLTSYEVNWILDGNVTKTRIISGHLTNPMSAYISELRPYTEYKIQVAAITGGGRGKFSEQYPALTDVAAPSAPFIKNVTVLSPTSVYLEWNPPTIYYNRIDYYVIKWWDTTGVDPQIEIPGTYTHYTLQDLDSNMKYSLKIAGATQAIFRPDKLIGEYTRPVTFTLGVESSDESKMIWDNMDPDYTPDEDRVPREIIAGVTCSIVFVLIIVAAFIGYRSLACQKCYQAAYYYLAVPSTMQSTPPTVVTVAEPSEEKEYPEISVSDFPAHVEAMHADSDFAFSQEFEDLFRNTHTDFRCEASNLLDNRHKNRYINIAAFDHSRVVLKNDAGRLSKSDYINANYVDGYQKPRAYIATQGPLPQTFADFWRMVWEQNCCVIVMITNLMEKGRRKCDQYWPSDGMEIYGSMSVKLLSTVQRAHYTVNIFSLRNMKVKKRHSMKSVSERTVYQYHYTEWPDHGVPDYTLPVLEFVQKSAARNPQDGGPIVVHCSAGVGRTGTYILIDSMIRQITDKGTINIPGFTLHIRRQRNLLVQTEDQYMFIHDVLCEYLNGGGQTGVSDDDIVTYVNALTSTSNGSVAHDDKNTRESVSTLEKQYKLATAYVPTEDDLSCALKPANSEKNRSPDFLPVNLKRVILPVRPGVEGSEYINASYLQGYRKTDEFIVTQYPLETTKEDFWRMVWDRNSPVIVVLKDNDDEELPDFWPEKDNTVEVDCGNFKLSMRDDPEEYISGYTVREFILESIQYDYIFMTKLVTVSGWPDSTPPQYSVFDLIETSIDWLRANDIGPVIVIDKYGGVCAGRFCALWALRDQLILDKSVDVYQLVKLYHLKRPGIVGSEDDLRYLYEAMAVLREHLQEEGSVCSSSPSHRHHSHGGSSVRKNGTLPRSSTLQNSAPPTPTTKNETNI